MDPIFELFFVYLFLLKKLAFANHHVRRNFMLNHATLLSRAILALALAGLTMLISCAQSQMVMNSWVNREELKGQKYHKVMILAMAANWDNRKIVEEEMGLAAEKEGIEVARSSDVLTPGTSTMTVHDKDLILQKVKEMNCDAIFTMSVKDAKSSDRYVQGTVVAYAPYPYHSYYGSFNGYYGYMAPVMSTPGYYTNDKTYILEGNLFDASTGKIIWSMQSDAYNPAGIRSFSREYAELVIYQIKKEGFLQK
jgi:hypothetical protein